MIEWWNKNKNDRSVVLQQIQTLTMKMKGRANAIFSAFGKSTSTPRVEGPTDSTRSDAAVNTVQCSVTAPEQSIVQDDVALPGTSMASRMIKAPIQLKVQQSLQQVNSELVTLVNAKDSGLSLSTDQMKRLKSLRNSKEDLSKKLKRLQTMQSSSKKHREKVKTAINRLRENNLVPASNPPVSMSQGVGRPRLERDQPGLMDAILKIVTHNSNADERRRTETLRSIRTLEELLKELRLLGNCLQICLLIVLSKSDLLS